MMASAFKCDSCGEYADGTPLVVHIIPPQIIDKTLKYELCPFCANEIIETLTKSERYMSESLNTEILENVKAYVMECSNCGHTYEHVNGDYEYCPHCKAMINS